MMYRADAARARRIQLSDWTRYVTRMHLGREFRQVPKLDSLADLPHDVKVKVDIGVGGENRRGEFSCREEMTKVGAPVAVAIGARACRLHGPLPVRVTRVCDQHEP